MSDIDSTPEFETLGDLIDAASVPSLVRAGRTVWAAGYGDGEDGFDAIEESDLWAWDDLSDGVVASWAPFRVLVDTQSVIADTIDALLEDRPQLSPDDVAKAILVALENAGFVVLDSCARCGEDPRAHWCADLEETFN